jgi:hypothetical protein
MAQQRRSVTVRDSYYWPPKFDPNADFEVAAWPRGFTVSGKQPTPGERFDKTAVKSERVLRELYEKRWIRMIRPFAELVEKINAAPVEYTAEDRAPLVDQPCRYPGPKKSRRRRVA